MNYIVKNLYRMLFKFNVNDLIMSSYGNTYLVRYSAHSKISSDITIQEYIDKCMCMRKVSK